MAPNKVAVAHNFSAGFEKTSDESFCQKTVEDSQKDAWRLPAYRHLSAVVVSKGGPILDRPKHARKEADANYCNYSTMPTLRYSWCSLHNMDGVSMVYVQP